jgi:signal transduction histidine kinase
VGVTVLLAGLHRTAEHDSAANATVEAAAAMVSLFAAALVLGWFLEQRRLHLLVLGAGVTVLAAANLFLAAIPTALSGDGSVAEWSALAARCGGAGVIAAAALTPPLRVPSPIRAVVVATGAAVATVVVLVIVIALAGPNGMIDGDRSVPAVQFATAMLYAIAAAGFAYRSVREGDDFLIWIAVGAGLAAVARVNYALAPSISPGLERAGDVLRVAMFFVLSAAVAREIVLYCRRLVARAAVRERRRIGRDVHDRIAQDLAYIVRDAQSLQLPEPVVSAAVRALEEARRVIEVAQQERDEPLWEAIARSTADIAGRSGAELALDVGPDAAAAPEVADALVHVAREAVVNADRHGRAKHIRIALVNGDGIRLSIADDGCGFAPADVHGSHFGLLCMRERIEGVGGRLTVTSAPGRGTKIEAHVP